MKKEALQKSKERRNLKMILLISLLAYVSGIILFLIELKRTPLVADDGVTIISENDQTIK